MASLAVLRSPSPPPGLSFDAHQFDGRRVYAVSAASELAFSDYRRMHVESHKSQRYAGYIPKFAFDDQKLRKVLAVAAWRYARGGRMPMPEEISLAELKRLAEEKFKTWEARSLEGLPEAERYILQRHLFSVDYAGGWLQQRATAAWLSWRFGLSSSQVAERLWTTAPNIRIILYRLTKIARSLGYETFTPGKWMGKFTVRQAHMTRLPPSHELLRIHQSNPYWTPGRLAKRFRVRRHTVLGALRRARRTT